ncbi:DUF721 domain-containing protein [Flavobacterium sp. U410]|jgi:hypothetical protein
MAKRLNEENSLADVLKAFIQTNNLQKGMDKIDVREAWKNVMGNGVNNYTVDVLLKKDVLHVILNSSVVREELSYGKEKIIRMINEELRRDIIKDVCLK